MFVWLFNKSVDNNKRKQKKKTLGAKKLIHDTEYKIENLLVLSRFRAYTHIGISALKLKLL